MPYNLGNLIGMAFFFLLIIAFVVWSRRKKK